MIVLDVSRLHKKFRKKKKKEIDKKTTRKKRINVMITLFVFLFFHHDSFRNIDGLFRDMGKSIKI